LLKVITGYTEYMDSNNENSSFVALDGNAELEGELSTIEDQPINENTFKSRFIKSLRISTYAQGMPMWNAMTLVILGIFFAWTTSLLVTGFQGLYPVLIEEGVNIMKIQIIL